MFEVFCLMAGNWLFTFEIDLGVWSIGFNWLNLAVEDSGIRSKTLTVTVPTLKFEAYYMEIDDGE